MNEQRPKVSISILTYNQVDFVGQAIDSALMQETDFSFEIRIGDDFSDDGTRELLEKYRERYPDKIFLNLQPSRPGGIIGRCNNMTNLASCRGEYIAMLDGDDYWTNPRKLQRQVDFLTYNPTYSAVVHDALRLNEGSGRILPRSFSEAARNGMSASETATIGQDLHHLELFQTSSVCFRRAMFPMFPEWFTEVFSADWALFLSLAGTGPIHYTNHKDAIYRIHPRSVVQSANARDRWYRARQDYDLFARVFPFMVTPGFKAIDAKNKAVIAALDRRLGAALYHAIDYARRDPGAFIRAMRTASRYGIANANIDDLR